MPNLTRGLYGDGGMFQHGRICVLMYIYIYVYNHKCARIPSSNDVSTAATNGMQPSSHFKCFRKNVNKYIFNR